MSVLASCRHILSLSSFQDFRRMTASTPALHDMVSHLSWLLGTWRSQEGSGKYPTIDSFKYGEELEFTHCGQPNLQFSFSAWDLETKKPLHREVGFVQVSGKEGEKDKVALVIAQNLGIAEVEEGTVKGQEISTVSHTLGRLTFGKPPVTKKISRIFRREGDELEQIVSMETDKTKMTEHLRIKYKKVK